MTTTPKTEPIVYYIISCITILIFLLILGAYRTRTMVELYDDCVNREARRSDHGRMWNPIDYNSIENTCSNILKK